MTLDISRERQTRLLQGIALRRPHRSPLWADLRESLRRRHLWLNLAWKDIRARYRRTVIGPFWTVLSTAALVAALGFVNSTLWHVDISTYLPFFCAGYISWLLFITIANESGSSLISAEAAIKAIGLPYSIFTFQLLSRNLIVFGHNLLVFAIVAAIFHVRPTASTLLLPVGLALVLPLDGLVGVPSGIGVGDGAELLAFATADAEELGGHTVAVGLGCTVDTPL